MPFHGIKVLRGERLEGETCGLRRRLLCVADVYRDSERDQQGERQHLEGAVTSHGDHLAGRAAPTQDCPSETGDMPAWDVEPPI